MKNEPTEVVISFRDPNQLNAHAKNSELYQASETPSTELVESIARQGILQPLVVTEDGTIISGHRRNAAAIKAGRKSVPVVVFPSTDELEILSALIASNRQRVKSNEEIGREFNLLVHIEKARAKERQSTNQAEQPRKAIATGKKGRARDKAAETLNVSGVTGERAGVVAQKITELEKEGKPDEAKGLRNLLNRNVERAFKSLNGSPTKTPKKQSSEKSTNLEAPIHSKIESHEAAVEAIDEITVFLDKVEEFDQKSKSQYVECIPAFLQVLRDHGLIEDEQA